MCCGGTAGLLAQTPQPISLPVGSVTNVPGGTTTVIPMGAMSNGAPGQAGAPGVAGEAGAAAAAGFSISGVPVWLWFVLGLALGLMLDRG